MTPWKTTIDGRIARWTDRLQWGHGDDAVEDSIHFAPQIAEVACFNGATAMTPWKTLLTMPTMPPDPALQWGHGDDAVEDRPPTPATSPSRALQWGHGDDAVEDGCNRQPSGPLIEGFNGATAMTPWKTPRRQFHPGRQGGFNGATAMTPWKTVHRRADEGLDSALQWGHGDDAVEDRRVGREGRRGDVASMGPRR